MKTALLVDVHNLYMATVKKYPGKVLNYIELLRQLTDNSYELFHKIAYGKQQPNDDRIRHFATMLKKNGFELVFGNTPHNIQMSVKAVDIINNANIECLVLGTNYFEVQHIFKYAREKGITTMSLGIGVPEYFNQFATIWEIDETLLQEKKVKEAEVPPQA